MSTEQETTRNDATQRTLHRPADEIADRPQLKVKPISRQEPGEEADPAAADAAAASEAVAQAATIIVEPPEAEAAPELPAEQPPAEQPEAEQAPMTEAPRKLAKLPRIDPNRGPSIFATHAPPPPDEAAEKAQLATVTGRKAKEREMSAGFLLGVALIVLTLVGGVIVVRLEKHVQRLENRISTLEQGHDSAPALSRLP